MLFGGHVKSLDDIDYLQHANFDLGEVILRSAKARDFWKDSGVTNHGLSDFFLIAHGPFEGPANDIGNLWKQYYPALRETVDVARMMAIDFLTVHLWVDPRFVRADVLKEKKRALLDLFNYGCDNDVLVSLENLSETAEDLADILDFIPELGITLDVGHGQLLTATNTSFGIMDRLMNSIKHVHLHDNRGGYGVVDDLHLPIGRGIIDFDGILRKLLKNGYDSTLTLELVPEDLIASRATVKELLDSIMHV